MICAAGRRHCGACEFANQSIARATFAGRSEQTLHTGWVLLEADRASSLRRRISPTDRAVHIRDNIVTKQPADHKHHAPIIADRPVMGDQLETAEPEILSRVHVLIMQTVVSLVERDAPEPSALTLAT